MSIGAGKLQGLPTIMGKQPPKPPRKFKPKQYYKCDNCGGTSEKNLFMKCDWCGSHFTAIRRFIKDQYGY